MLPTGRLSPVEPPAKFQLSSQACRASAAATRTAVPSTASAAKTPRQALQRSTSPPTVGASTGEAPITSMSRENSVAAALP